MTWFSLLIDRCDIYHYAEAGRTDGTPTYETQPAAASVPCRLSYSKGREVESDAETLIYTETTLYLPADTDIRAGDKVDVAEQTFRALPPRPVGDHHLEVPLTRVTER